MNIGIVVGGMGMGETLAERAQAIEAIRTTLQQSTDPCHHGKPLLIQGMDSMREVIERYHS